jgi:hypothetical protein
MSETTPVAETDTGSDAGDKKTKRLTPAQWDEARSLYELGDVTMQDLSSKFGISVSAISQKFKTDKVERGSRRKEVAEKATEKAVEKTAEEILSFGQRRKQRIEETKERIYRTSDMIHKLADREMVEANKKGEPIASRAANLKALRLAAAIIESTHKSRAAILEMETDIDELMLPEIIIRDLSDDEIARLQNKDEDEFAVEVADDIEDEVIVEES